MPRQMLIYIYFCVIQYSWSDYSMFSSMHDFAVKYAFKNMVN